MGSSNPRLSVPRDPPVWCEAETGSAVNITPELSAEQEETLSKHGRRRAVINPHPRMVGRSGRLGAATRVVPQRFVFRLCLLVRQRRFFRIGKAACELMQSSVRWHETLRASRQAREYPRRAGPARARVSGQRLVMQRPCESKALQLSVRFARQKSFHMGGTPDAERIPKPWVWRRSLDTFCRCWQKVSRRRQHKGCSASECGSPRARRTLAMAVFRLVSLIRFSISFSKYA